jgi:hypothetical protein
LTDMTQPPEIIKSMVASIDSDIEKTSEVQKEVSNLAEKTELVEEGNEDAYKDSSRALHERKTIAGAFRMLD